MMIPLKLPELYEEKKEILIKIISHLNDNKMGYINVPTGWGKTFLSKHLIKEYLEKEKKIIFITSGNKQLLRQTYYLDEQKEIKLFPKSICLSSDFQINTWLENNIINFIQNNNLEVIFASLQAILSKKKEKLAEFFSKYFDLFIIDEVHNFIKNRGNGYLNIIKEYNKNCHIFGMTATPYQGIIGNVKFVEEIDNSMTLVYYKNISKCIIDEELSPLIYHIVRNQMNIDEIFDFGADLKALDSTELFLDGRKIDKIIQRTKLAKQIYDEKINPNSKTLIFCAPVRDIAQIKEDDKKKIPSFHAKLSSAIFNEEVETTINPDIAFNNKNEDDTFKKAVYLSSDLSENQTIEIIKDFKHPEKPPFILCTVGKLIEGFDFPELKNLILLRPTLSMRLFEQQIGRVVRKHENKNAGNIFEIVESIDLDALYEKFGEIVFSEKKLRKILMLNPEHRIEELFIQTPEDMKVVTENFIQVKEYEMIDIEKIQFEKFELSYKEFIKQIPPIDFRLKVFLTALNKINLKTEGSFKKERQILMSLASRLNLFIQEDFNKIIPILPIIKNIMSFIEDDPNHSQNAKKNKPKMLHEIFWFIKLKILSDLENSQNFSEEEKQNYIKLLNLEKQSDNYTDLKDHCLFKAKNINLEKFKKNIRERIKVINRFNKIKESGKKFFNLPKSQTTRILNGAVNQLKTEILWVNAYFHGEISEFYNLIENKRDIKEFGIGVL